MLSPLLPLFAGPAVLLPLAAYAVAHRRVRAAGWCAILLFVISHWSLMYAWELTAGALEFKILALKVKYLGIAVLPIAWLGFVLDFVGTDRERVRRNVRRTAVVSAVLLLLAWTNDLHGWFWGDIRVDASGPLDLLVGRGPGFVANVVFIYSVLWAGIGILATRAYQSPHLYARPAGTIIAAVVLPWMGNLLFLTNATTVAHVDPTPLLFACSGVLAALALFRYRVLDPALALTDARIENLGDGVIVLDAAGRIVDLNDAAAALLGRTGRQAAGEPASTLLPGWTGVAADGRQDLSIPTPDGVRVFEARTTAIRTGESEAAGYMVLLHDVTDRRAADAAIQASEQRYRQLVENAQDVIFSCDAEGRLLSINRAGLELTGYAEEELIGRPVTDIVLSGSRAAVLQGLAEVAEGAQQGRAEVVVVAKDGRRIRLEVSSWIQDGDGAPRTVQAIARDLTGREMLEARLRQSQKMEAVGRLAAGIAHDFNNLLTAILGFADMAERPLPDESPAREAIAQIRRSGQQAAALTKQLLAFARRQILQPVVLDLNQVIGELDTILRRLLGEDIVVEQRLAADLQRVRVDLAQIQQVIINLALNGRDAMPHGGGLVIETANATLDADSQAHVSLTPGRYVTLSMTDTGHGIPEEVLQRIFEPFFTTKAMGHGTGLGLATVHGIVKQSGGEIVVRTERERGTRFTIYLPATDAPLTQQPAAPRIESVSPPGGTVMLVEDDEAVREFATETLRARGWMVLDAAGPRQALAFAADPARRIDIVVTDVVMPGMSGGELAERLAILRPGVPVLFISGYADAEIIGRGQLKPGRRLLQKPFTGAELCQRVAELATAEREAPLVEAGSDGESPGPAD